MNFFKNILDVFTKPVEDTSPAGEVDKTDLAKVARTGIYVAISAGLAYILGHVEPDVFGPYAPFITMAGTAFLEFINKLVKDNK